MTDSLTCEIAYVLTLNLASQYNIFDNFYIQISVSNWPSSSIMLCFECGWEAVGGKNALHMHFESRHKEQSLNCSNCTKICTSLAALEDHIRMVHDEKKSCDFLQNNLKKGKI